MQTNTPFPWILLALWAFPTASWIWQRFLKTAVSGRLLQRRVRRFPPNDTPLVQPFDFLPGYRARVCLEGPTILGRKAAAGSRALVLHIEGDETTASMPFQVTSHRQTKTFIGGVVSDALNVDTRAPVSGDRVAFYALLDAATRNFLDRHEFAVATRTLTVVLADSRFDEVRAITHLAPVAAQLDQVRHLLQRLTASDLIAAFPQRFAPEEPEALRQRALEAWWQQSPRQGQAAVPLPPPSDASTPEMVWFRLDLGAVFEMRDLNLLCHKTAANLNQPELDPFAGNLRALLHRHPTEQQQQWVEPFLFRPERQGAAAAVLADFPDACANATVIAAYRRGPKDANLLRAIVDENCEETVAFLIEVLHSDRFRAQAEAARRLAVCGNRAAILPLEEVARSMSPQTGIVFKDAALRLRERFAVNHEPGALSPVRAEGQVGSLSYVDEHGRNLSPADAPQGPAGTPAVKN